jgi:hypothetical protein
MRTRLLPTLVAAVVLGVAGGAWAQIDPEPRKYLEVGAEAGLRGDSPLTGYAFFLWNVPHFTDDDLYLRLIVAPTFLVGELVRDRFPSEGHAVGLSVAGGAFPYNFDDYRMGRHEEGESFWGHGGEVNLAYYRRLTVFDVLPIEGQLRLRPQYVVYQRSGDTDARFELPADTAIYSARLGVRVGGVPPELLPALALELSLWYEPSYRDAAGAYGLPERRQETEHFTQRAWGRLGGVYTLGPGHAVSALVTAGTAENADSLSGFRLGSALPFRSEFPMILHGYYLDEVSARRFWLVNLTYRFPVWPGSDRVSLQLAADYARVDYLPGRELPRHGLRGVGADLCLQLTTAVRVMLGYGYGLDAPRSGGFGGHEAHTLLEVKF